MMCTMSLKNTYIKKTVKLLILNSSWGVHSTKPQSNLLAIPHKSTSDEYILTYTLTILNIVMK